MRPCGVRMCTVEQVSQNQLQPDHIRLLGQRGLSKNVAVRVKVDRSQLDVCLPQLRTKLFLAHLCPLWQLPRPCSQARDAGRRRHENWNQAEKSGSRSCPGSMRGTALSSSSWNRHRAPHHKLNCHGPTPYGTEGVIARERVRRYV